jgi:hypothetical protein
MRKLWQETRDPECKTIVKWGSKIIKRMTRKETVDAWEIALAKLSKDILEEETCLIHVSLASVHITA